MTYAECKVGMKVVDRWYVFDWGVGQIEQILKTVVRIKFADRMRTYDKQHLQFLKPFA